MFDRKRINDSDVVLPKITSEEIDNLISKFYDWIETTISPDELYSISEISYKTAERLLAKEKKTSTGLL